MQSKKRPNNGEIDDTTNCDEETKQDTIKQHAKKGQEESRRRGGRKKPTDRHLKDPGRRVRNQKHVGVGTGGSTWSRSRRVVLVLRTRVARRVMRRGPPLALGTPTERFGIARDGFDSRVARGRRSKAPSFLHTIVTSGVFVFDAIRVRTTTTLLQVRTLAFPMTRFFAVIAQTRFDATRRKAVLHEGHDLNIRQVCGGEGGGRSSGILSVLGRRPFRRIFQTTVPSLHGLTDVRVEKPSAIHMGLGGSLFLQSDLLEGSFEALMKGTKGEAKGLVPITATLEKNLKHLEGQGVIIVTGHCQDLGVNTEVFDELDHVLTCVLRRVSTLNLMFQLFKAVNRG
jgi:hypothetical protein